VASRISSRSSISFDQGAPKAARSMAAAAAWWWRRSGAVSAQVGPQQRQGVDDDEPDPGEAVGGRREEGAGAHGVDRRVRQLGEPSADLGLVGDDVLVHQRELDDAGVRAPGADARPRPLGAPGTNLHRAVTVAPTPVDGT